MIPFDRIARIVTSGGYMIFEAYMVCYTLLSAAVLLNPYTDLYSNGRAYVILASFSSENALGSVFLFSGLVSLFALYSLDLKFRKWAMLGQTALWLVIFAVMVAPSASVWLPLTLFFNTAFCAVSYARMVIDERSKYTPQP